MHLLGAVFAILSAATFALTNAIGRKGVISGTPAQGMVISMPVGLACFLCTGLLTGAFQSLGRFTPHALAALSAAGVLHFVIGRYCNFRASQAAGVNLTAPVIQLNSVVTLALAVLVLREPCTLLQIAGAVLMVTASLVTQRTSQPSGKLTTAEPSAFTPQIAVGFLFASGAALAYGTSPVIVRQTIQDGGLLAGLAGVLVAYAAATMAVSLSLLVPGLRRNVMMVTKENARWFVYSGIFVAAAQGFLYAALSVAPIMLVAPLLQLGLVFRYLFSLVLNPHHEVFGLVVIAGTVFSILGACIIAIDTSFILHALSIPEPYAGFLRSQPVAWLMGSR